MTVNSALQFWLASSMFIVGILLVALGLWILFLPAHFLRVGQSLSRWISTDHYFEALDRPRYQERFIYKHHHIAGGLIITGALYTLVMLITRVDFDVIQTALPVVINRLLSEWLYISVYYLLVVANLLALLVGLVIFIRPSALKGVEQKLNHWVSADRQLKKLDETHEIALEVLPGNPRLFGLAVMLGGLYIALSMAILLL